MLTLSQIDSSNINLPPTKFQQPTQPIISGSIAWTPRKLCSKYRKLQFISLNCSNGHCSPVSSANDLSNNQLVFMDIFYTLSCLLSIILCLSILEQYAQTQQLDSIAYGLPCIIILITSSSYKSRAQIIMGFIFALIVINSLLLLAFPIVFKLVFVYVLGFSKANIKLKNPFKFVSTQLVLKQPIWGIEMITIFVPEIKITLDIKNVKICMVITKPRIMLSRSSNQLLSLKIVDGLKQNNLLYNLMVIIKSIKTGNSQQKANKSNQSKSRSQESRLSLGFKALMQFIGLFLMQFIQIRINKGDVGIVASLPKQQYEYNSRKETRVGITLLESFSQYLIFVDELKVGANLHDDHEINIVFSCPLLKLYTARHMENVLINSQNMNVSIRIPFTFSWQRSMQNIGIYITAPKLISQSTPVDFENFSKIINQMLFDQKIFADDQFSLQLRRKGSVEQASENPSNKKFVLSIEEAEVRMTELCEPDQDTSEALKYLSNIELAILKFQRVKLNDDGFTVSQASLSLKKYDKLKQNYVQKQRQPSFRKEVLRISNLLINKQNNTTRISHDDVKVSCQRQELALLGKLFTLINSRVVIEEYDEIMYLPYLEIARNYHLNLITLEQALYQIMLKKSQSTFEMTSAQTSQTIQHESSLIYSPKQIELQLDISELIHKITLYNSEYRQGRTIAGEINHELTFKRITMEYKTIKEFIVADFKLFYKQTETANELELQVADIHMTQDNFTLKDYFIGFTMFKLLLQFSSDEEQLEENPVKKSAKTSKKSLNFAKIILKYALEQLTLRKLSVMKQSNADGKLSSLYFSLAKCDFSVDKIYQKNKILKYPLSQTHNLLSVTSVTIKQFLTASLTSTLAPKQKYMINIKNPVLLLPEVDVSDRLLNYVKTFNKLQPSLQAFMNNTTDEKIRAKRRKYKIFMVDTDIFMVKITNLLVGIQDTVFDSSMLNRMRFHREYLERKPKYNQSETINFLKQTSQILNLLEIQIESISIEVKPLESAGINEKSVKQWAAGLREMYMGKSEEKFNVDSGPRLIRVNNFHLDLDISDYKVKIRDYPFNIMSISKVKGGLEYLKTKNIYEETSHFLKSSVFIDQVSVQIGLSILSGLAEVYRKLSKYSKSLDEYKNTDQFLHTLKTKSSVELSSFKPYWHIMHKSADWYIDIRKQSQIRIKLLTGLTPYSKQSLSLSLGSLFLKSTPIKTQFSIEYLQLKGNKLKMFEVGKQTVQLSSVYNQPDLNIMLNLEVESQNNSENRMLKDNIVRVSEEIIKELWKIQQLRTDWLLIYGLVEPMSKKQQNVLKRQEQSSYVQLFKMAANLQLKNRDKELSIFSVIKQVKINAKIDKFCLQLADQENEVDLIISNFNFALASQAKLEKWKMRHFLVMLQSIIGRLKIYKKKAVAHYQSNYQFLKLFSDVNLEDIKRHKQERQTFKQIFLVCRGLKIKIGEYAVINNQIVYLMRKIQADSLKVQLTPELKKMLDSLFYSIFQANKKKVDDLTRNKYFKMSATQKLRETVVLVIRANRKKKNFCDRIKTYVVLKSVQIGFKIPKKLLLLTNGRPTSIKYNTTFVNDDLYHVDPKISIIWLFETVQIWVTAYPNYLWIIGKETSPQILHEAERILKCSKISFNLQKHENQNLPPHYEQLVEKSGIERHTSLHLQICEGVIELTRPNIQVLKEIGEILIKLVDTKQEKRREWQNQKQKYSEMISHGRENVKSKLSWKYSDISKGQQPTLISKVFLNLDKVNITLIGSKNADQAKQMKQQVSSRSKQSKIKYPMLSLITSDIAIKVGVYSEEALKRQFQINNLTIINCMEPEDSIYRTLFEMNHGDNLAIELKIDQRPLSANNPKVFWTFFKEVFIRIYPVKIKMTEQLYNEIYFFFFGIKPETDEIEEELSNIIPDFYLSVLLDQIKVQAWFRTPSRLKRLEGVNIGLEKFQLKNEFLDNKTLFDRWVSFLIKQLASQFFNVIGQKLFG